MEIIKIGRDSTCNILLNNEMISRHHAILRIYSTGKIELISLGANGTKLNGIMLRPNVIYKVKRSDMVSFAGKYQLDWAQIPDPLKKYRIIGICLLACLLLGGLVFAGYKVYDYFNPQIENQSKSSNTNPIKQGTTKRIGLDNKIDKNNDISISIENVIENRDSIKKAEEREKRRINSVMDKLFPDKGKNKKGNSSKKGSNNTEVKEKTEKTEETVKTGKTVKTEVKEKTEEQKKETKQENKTEEKKADDSNDIKNNIIL